MFGSTILDIVIGMVFVFLLLSLVCSAVNELIEAVLKNRAKDLERGIAEFVGDPATAPQFLSALYNHGLINSLFKGSYPPASKADLPSYIPASAFALAVMDLARNPPAPGFTLPPNLRAAITILERQAGGDAAKLQAGLEEWFNHRMDRIAGWYKRRVQWILVALGLIVAVALNADTVRIAQSLSNDASVRQGLVASIQAHGIPAPATAADPAPASASPSAADPQTAATANPAASPKPVSAFPTAVNTASPSASIDAALKQLNSLGLQIGWQDSDVKAADEALAAGWGPSAKFLGMEAKTHLLGWLLTAIAISMGAPFWFDLLNRFIAVRSTLKPQTADGAAQAIAPPQPIAVTLAAGPPPAPLGPPLGNAAPPQPPPVLAGNLAPPQPPELAGQALDAAPPPDADPAAGEPKG